MLSTQPLQPYHIFSVVHHVLGDMLFLANIEPKAFDQKDRYDVVVAGTSIA